MALKIRENCNTRFWLIISLIVGNINSIWSWNNFVYLWQHFASFWSSTLCFGGMTIHDLETSEDTSWKSLSVHFAQLHLPQILPLVHHEFPGSLIFRTSLLASMSIIIAIVLNFGNFELNTLRVGTLIPFTYSISDMWPQLVNFRIIEPFTFLLLLRMNSLNILPVILVLGYLLSPQQADNFLVHIFLKLSSWFPETPNGFCFFAEVFHKSFL